MPRAPSGMGIAPLDSMISQLLAPVVFCLSVSGGPGAPPGPGCAAPVQDGALAGFIRSPDVYVEVSDLGRLERDLRQSGLGRLVERILPLLEESLEEHAEAGVEPVKEFLARAREGGEGELWERAVRALLEELAPQVGLGPAEAARAAAALGPRVSIAVQAPGEGSAKEGEPVFGWSLRSGGAEILAGEILPRVQQALAGKIEVAPVALEGTARAWRLGPEDRGRFLVLRSEMLVWTSSRDLLAALSSEPSAGRSSETPFLAARRAGLQRGDALWCWLDGDLVRRGAEGEGEEALAALGALGIDTIEDIVFGLSERAGQLTTRLRVSRRGHAGIFALARGARSDWRSLDALTSDTLAVAGLPHSAREVAQGVTLLAARVSPEAAAEVGSAWRELAGAPLLGALLSGDALADETLILMRPGPALKPAGYLVLPGGPGFDTAFAGLDASTKLAAKGWTLSGKPLEGDTCWILAPEQRSSGPIAMALFRQGDLALITDGAYAVKDWLRQRSREDPEARERLIRGLRASLEGEIAAVGSQPEHLAGFLHVRTEALAGFLWPAVMMVLGMAGVQGFEDLPDAEEAARLLGDTMILILEDERALEVHGRGALGGLGIVF
jgi:hypothetical protein